MPILIGSGDPAVDAAGVAGVKRSTNPVNNASPKARVFGPCMSPHLPLRMIAGARAPSKSWLTNIVHEREKLRTWGSYSGWFGRFLGRPECLPHNFIVLVGN